MSKKTNNEKHQEKIEYIDLLRLLAALGVIVIHVTTNVVINYNSLFLSDWWWGNALNAASRWSVPVFVMMSGALLLDPSKHTSWKVFLRKRITRVAGPLVVATAIYALFFNLIRGDELTVSAFFHRLVFDQPYDHLYFLWLLLELGFLTLLLQQIVSQLNMSALRNLTVLFLGITLFWTEKRFLFILFIPFIGYYLAGYYLSKVHVTRLMAVIAGVMSVSSWLIISVVTWLSFAKVIHFSDPLRLYTYTNLPVMVCSLSVFSLGKFFLSVKNTPLSIPSRRLYLQRWSHLTFNIYLVHPIVIFGVEKITGISAAATSPTIIGIVFVTALTVVFSTLISAVLPNLWKR